VSVPPLVFITGASSGIGQALAGHYLRAGWRLALVARRGAVMRSWLEGCGGANAGEHAVYVADVGDRESLSAAAHECLHRQGLPDVVIANAGISIGMDTGAVQDLDVLARTLAINVTGLAASFQPFLGRCASVAAGASSLWRASRVYGGCLDRRRIARARRRPSATARACAANSAAAG